MYKTLDVKYMENPPTILWNLRWEKKKKNPVWGTLFYPYMFFLRRSVFVLITFLLFTRPGIQINVLLYSSILYIIFITHWPKFNPKTVMWVEVINESILLLICYHMILLSNIVWVPWVKEAVGYSIIGCLAILLSGNTIYMTMLNIKGFLRKKRLAFMKMKFDYIMRERNAALEALVCAEIFNETLDDDKDIKEILSNHLVLKHE